MNYIQSVPQFLQIFNASNSSHNVLIQHATNFKKMYNKGLQNYIIQSESENDCIHFNLLKSIAAIQHQYLVIQIYVQKIEKFEIQMIIMDKKKKKKVITISHVNKIQSDCIYLSNNILRVNTWLHIIVDLHSFTNSITKLTDIKIIGQFRLLKIVTYNQQNLAKKNKNTKIEFITIYFKSQKIKQKSRNSVERTSSVQNTKKILDINPHHIYIQNKKLRQNHKQLGKLKIKKLINKSIQPNNKSVMIYDISHNRNLINKSEQLSYYDIQNTQINNSSWHIKQKKEEEIIEQIKNQIQSRNIKSARTAIDPNSCKNLLRNKNNIEQTKKSQNLNESQYFQLSKKFCTIIYNKPNECDIKTPKFDSNQQIQEQLEGIEQITSKKKYSNYPDYLRQSNKENMPINTNNEFSNPKSKEGFMHNHLKKLMLKVQEHYSPPIKYTDWIVQFQDNLEYKQISIFNNFTNQ